MDTELLKTLGLEQEAIDKILKEAQKDTDELARVTQERDGYKMQLDNTVEKIKTSDGVDVEKLQSEITTLRNDLTAKDEDYKQQLANRDFNDDLSAAAREAGVINLKAVTALLDTDALKGSKNRKDDITAAILALKESDPNQFQTEQAPPPYAAGTGSSPIPGAKHEDTLRRAMGLSTKE